MPEHSEHLEPQPTDEPTRNRIEELYQQAHEALPPTASAAESILPQAGDRISLHDEAGELIDWKVTGANGEAGTIWLTRDGETRSITMAEYQRAGKSPEELGVQPTQRDIRSALDGPRPAPAPSAEQPPAAPERNIRDILG